MSRIFSNSPKFRRRVVTLGYPIPKSNQGRKFPIATKEQSALIINSSHEMAKEISLALSIKMPTCSLLYAPTIQVARWILMRKRVDLIVSNPILPDGSITSLVPLLESMEKRPDLVVIGELNTDSAKHLSSYGYELNSLRSLSESKNLGANDSLSYSSSKAKSKIKPTNTAPYMENSVQKLGAHLRDRLNNPLQEIVAMAFVAQAGEALSSTTEQALDAIQRAAQNMSGIVNALEDQIRKAVIV